MKIMFNFKKLDKLQFEYKLLFTGYQRRRNCDSCVLIQLYLTTPHIYIKGFWQSEDQKSPQNNFKKSDCHDKSLLDGCSHLIARPKYYESHELVNPILMPENHQTY